MTSSVLMSVYKNDDPGFLKLALESIYDKQTLKPDEIVVVFDGPLTDELYQVLDEFRCGKEEFVKYLPQEVNRGLGEALRIGSLECKGDLIFRMDSDDISTPDRFEVQREYMISHSDIDTVGTDIAEFAVSAEEETRVRACPGCHEEIAEMGKTRNPMNHVSVCIRRSALEKCGGYEGLDLLEDYYLWLKMIANGCRLANINRSLVYVRVGNGFNGRRASKSRIKGWKVLQNYMLEQGMITKKKAFRNMVTIYGFVYCPGFVRRLAYKLFLRK